MIGNNIKKLRDSLNLTQTQFAAQIGITQGTIAAVESNKRNISQQAKLAICREFGVRLEWLETGEGEMYKLPDTSVLAQLEKEKVLTAKGRELMEHFLKLPANLQDLVADAIKAAATMYPAEGKTEEVVSRKPDSELTRAEKHALLDLELDAQEAAGKRAMKTSSASTGTNGILKKIGNST